MDFNLETATSIIQSSENYPISYENACRWADITSSVGERILLFEFKEGFDYIKTKVQNGKRGRPINSWKLSLVCFNCFVALTNKDPDVGYNIRYLLNQALDNLKLKTSQVPKEDKLPLTFSDSVIHSVNNSVKDSVDDFVDLNICTLLRLELKTLSTFVHQKFHCYDSSLLKLNKELSFILEELRNQNSALMNNRANSNKGNNHKN